MAHDLFWFETKVLELVRYSEVALLDKCNYSAANTIANVLQETLGKLGELLALDEAFLLFRDLRLTISEHIAKAEAAKKAKQEEQTLCLALALTDYHLLGLINLLLAMSRRLRETTADSLGRTVAAIKWEREGDIYLTALPLPRPVLEQLEYLRKGLMFERKVEGRVFSPLWYLQQLTGLAFVRMIQKGTAELVGELERSFADMADSRNSAKQHVFAAQIAQRGLEACNKFHVHLGEAAKCVERLSAFRRVEDIPWPSIPWSALHERVAAVHDRLVLAFSIATPTLAEMPRSERLPDYFGQSYSVLAQECYRAVATGNESFFAKIFPSCFAVSLAAQERLRAGLTESDKQRALIFSTEPLVDLLTLSGYGIVYSELDGKGYAKRVSDLWEQYFAVQPDPKVFLRYIVSVIEYRDSLFAILPRDPARSSWEQDMVHRMRERRLIADCFSPSLDEESAGSRHRSPIIRALTATSGLPYYGAEDIFLAVYLSSRPELAGEKLPMRAAEFLRALKEEGSLHDPSGAEGES